jgi:hypothetical protein
MGTGKDCLIEEIRSATIEELYDILASCQSPGYYQMAVEELQRRFLQEVASKTEDLSKSQTGLRLLQVSCATPSPKLAFRLTSWLALPKRWSG